MTGFSGGGLFSTFKESCLTCLGVLSSPLILIEYSSIDSPSFGGGGGGREFFDSVIFWVGAHGIEPWTSFLSGTRSTTEPRTPTKKLLTVFYHLFYKWPSSAYHDHYIHATQN